VCPDLIQSKNDGEWDYITHSMLIKLYNVPPHQCISWERAKGMTEEYLKDLIVLHPRYGGDYRLEGEKHE